MTATNANTPESFNPNNWVAWLLHKSDDEPTAITNKLSQVRGMFELDELTAGEQAILARLKDGKATRLQLRDISSDYFSIVESLRKRLSKNGAGIAKSSDANGVTSYELTINVKKNWFRKHVQRCVFLKSGGDRSLRLTKDGVWSYQALTVAASKTKAKPVACVIGSHCKLKDRPRLTIRDCLLVREAVLSGCSLDAISEAMGIEGLGPKECGEAVSFTKRYSWVKLVVDTTKDEYLPIDPRGKTLSGEILHLGTERLHARRRLYCQVCGRRRKPEHVRASRLENLAVSFFKDGRLCCGVACSRECKAQAARNIQREITWIQEQQYWIDQAASHLKKLRRLLAQRLSRSEESKPLRTLPS